MPREKKLLADMEYKPLVPVKHRCLWGVCKFASTSWEGLEQHWVDKHEVKDPVAKPKMQAPVNHPTLFDLREYQKPEQ